MINHENGRSRPTYFTIKDKDILWFIPLSSKVSKYQSIVDKKIKKYGNCKSIMNGKPLKVIDTLKEEILNNFKYLMVLKQEGRNLFFADIGNIKEQILNEIQN